MYSDDPNVAQRAADALITAGPAAGYSNVRVDGLKVIATVEVPDHLRDEVLSGLRGGMRGGYSIGCRSTKDLG